jgi:hypothetical protein
LAHLLAAAILELYPDTKNTIGPAIDNGFYYDFEFSSPFSDTDLKEVEKKMKKTFNGWKSFEHKEVSAGEAKEFFKKNFEVLTYDSLEEYNKCQKKAKIILMSHSLEHYQISDLDSLFSEIKFTLEDSGVIIIEVPHCDMRIHSEIRGNDTPHTLFFSKESLKLLLEKNGFDVLFIDTCGDQWQTEFEYDATINSTSNLIKKRIRPIYNNMPIKLQNLIRIFVRLFYHLRNSNFFRRGYYTSIPQHTYGGNRNCLRVVAKKYLNKVS